MLVFQSVRELLFNVLKHAGTGRAELSVETSTEDQFAITVTDKGHGFDCSQVEKGKRFGLFSIRERMEAMGGRFQLESTPEQGTWATLILPNWLATQERAQCSVRSALEESAQSSGLRAKLEETQDSPLRKNAMVRVLLADDHAMVRQGLSSILDAYPDVSVIGEAADGEEAVELARSLSPDVVVMDVNMPRMDGIEATRRIKAQRPDSDRRTVIVHSNEVEPLLRQAGASSYVSKDVAGDRLYEAIIEAVKGEAEPCSVESPAMSLKVPSPEGLSALVLLLSSRGEREG